MTYIEKEQNILNALQKQNYDMFDGDKDDALDFIANRLNAFPTYANIVINQQIMTPIIYQRYDGQELRDRIQSIDEHRKSAHDNAISSVNILNRLSNNLGLEPFATVDTSDRYKVADFIGEYVSQVYDMGQGKSLDDAVLNKRKEYPLDHKSRLQDLNMKFGDILEKTEESEMGL